MTKTSFLGIIPARGGSKGIPRKNIKMLGGKPLIAWSIEAAQNSKLLDRLVVSTEDREIAGVAEQFGAQVLERPAQLATDEATTLSVLQHVLGSIDAQAIVLLQPTSPVREEGLIDSCIRQFQDGGYDCLATGFMCTLKEYGAYTQRRQDLKGFFHDDGNVYVVKSELIHQGTLFGKKAGRKEISRDQNIEIDDEFDFWMAEQILQRRIYEQTVNQDR